MSIIPSVGVWSPDAAIFGSLRTARRALSDLIASLFKSGEQGFAYDINDLSTLYQDAAGTIPVTAAGQPVGLMLDKSKGLVLGPERLVNGDFSNGGANWNVNGADATHIVTFADGKVRYQSDTISPVLSLNQGGAVVTGKWYEVTINCSSYVSGSLKIDAGNGAPVVVSGLGTFKTKILASTNVFVLVRNSPNVDLTIDSISVKELAGNHAYQTTSASRPLLQRNATTGAYYLVFDGTDDFLVTSSINFTATDKVSLFAGVRKLSDSGDGSIIELSAGYSTNSGTFAIGASYPANPRYVLGTRGASAVGAYGLDGYVAPNSAVISGRLDLRGSSLAAAIIPRVNGSLPALTPLVNNPPGSGNYGNYPLYIGRRGGTSLPFNGHIYSLIGVGRLSTDAETTNLEKAIAKNVGVTL